MFRISAIGSGRSLRTSLALVIALSLLAPLGACDAGSTDGNARMDEVATDWQAVTSAPSGAAETAAMEAFWRAHVAEPGASLQMSMADAETGAPVAVNDFDADAPAAHEVTVVLDGETLRFRPKSADSVHILMRE